MRVVVLEDYLNYATDAARIAPLKRSGEVVVYTSFDEAGKFAWVRGQVRGVQA